jgi:hypothetical protein
MMIRRRNGISTQTYSAEVQEALMRDDEVTFAEACQAAGIGEKDCVSKTRIHAKVRAREVVVWLLLKSGWTQVRVAVVARLSTRHIKRIAKKMAVMSPFRVT